MQVLTWIATQNDDYVAVAGGPANNPGAETPLFLVDINVTDWKSDNTVVTVAESELLDELRSGQLSAEAIRNDRDESQIIKPSDWSRGRIQFDPTRLVLGRDHWWSDILFDSAEVLAIWPLPDERRLTIGAETECFEWLCEEMQAGPQNGAKPEYEAEAIATFGVSQRAFNRAWANAVRANPDSNWGKSGRPKKNQYEKTNAPDVS
jgi:hypothetical protein